MDKYVTHENPDTDLHPMPDGLSPYDAAYPLALLNAGINKCLAQAGTAADRLYREIVRHAPEAAQLQQAMKKGYRLIVDIPESTLKAIDTGKLKLSMGKNGQCYAQLMDENGHFSTKLPIKREAFARGVDPVQMANAMQMKALQAQLESITEQISAIDRSVREVLQGLQNDRIGLYYSGVALYLEAMNVTDEEMKKTLMVQALRALAEASFQLSLTMKADIQYLVDKEYDSVRGKRAALICERMNSINQSFAYIHQATLFRAAIYCNQNELAAMSTVLEEYSGFIKGTVAKNAPLLAQCDVADNGTEKGLWKSRAKLQLDVSQLARELRSPEKTIYIGVAEVGE
ncbi:hypothetical protein SDC9_67789 [bioreactor metagenome]|uniref:Uncharacterized protein n=1 Tax=bioreactor metagenome TaxID=1076179 RepID=A0A644XYP2_9ZZZZ